MLSLTRSKALMDAVVESQVSKSAKPGAPGTLRFRNCYPGEVAWFVVGADLGIALRVTMAVSPYGVSDQ